MNPDAHVRRGRLKSSHEYSGDVANSAMGQHEAMVQQNALLLSAAVPLPKTPLRLRLQDIAFRWGRPASPGSRYESESAWALHIKG